MISSRNKKESVFCVAGTNTSCRDSDLLKEISLLVRSRYGLIYLMTVEEERAEALLKHLSDALGLPLFTWTAGRGLSRAGLDTPVYGTGDPGKALDHIYFSDFPAVYCMPGLAPFLESNPVLGAKLTTVVRKFSQKDGVLVVTGTDMIFPEAVKPHMAEMSFKSPTRQDYASLLKHIYRDVMMQMPVKIVMTPADMNRLLNNLQGLTLLEAGKILTKAMIEDGKLDADDIQLVIQAKRAIVEREGLLEYFPVEESMTDIADLVQLKAWLAKRKIFIVNPEKASQYGLQFPKGILLLGVPGAGKSLCAKAVAMEWGLPLLKMDPSNLYNKYIGESEKNFKRAMQAAEKMSPVVLWIDEIEKAFASGKSEDGGVSQRVLGIFLSWMQEHRGNVFVVATANDVTALPAEFLRKGRFDEIFFVDLPTPDVRKIIFEIHLKRRGCDPRAIDLDAAATITEGFSGAEIEQVVVSALYTAMAESVLLNTDILIREARTTRPLSQTRAEQIQALRSWARERTVSAQ